MNIIGPLFLLSGCDTGPTGAQKREYRALDRAQLERESAFGETYKALSLELDKGKYAASEAPCTLDAEEIHWLDHRGSTAPAGFAKVEWGYRIDRKFPSDLYANDSAEAEDTLERARNYAWPKFIGVAFAEEVRAPSLDLGGDAFEAGVALGHAVVLDGTSREVLCLGTTGATNSQSVQYTSSGRPADGPEGTATHRAQVDRYQAENQASALVAAYNDLRSQAKELVKQQLFVATAADQG